MGTTLFLYGATSVKTREHEQASIAQRSDNTQSVTIRNRGASAPRDLISAMQSIVRNFASADFYGSATLIASGYSEVT